jgi:putative intracellular protease/amidase
LLPVLPLLTGRKPTTLGSCPLLGLGGGSNLTMNKRKNILIVATNVDEFQKVGIRTGLWFAELVDFWIVASYSGYQMEIASPAGGKIPLDPQSLLVTELGDAIGIRGDLFHYYNDKAFMASLTDTAMLGDIDPDAYDALYMTGGHGVVFDYPGCEALLALIRRFHYRRTPIAAVCHGPVALLDVTLDDGEPLLKGKKVTAYSWKEEILAKRDHAVPFSLEDELRKRGADYSKALMPLGAHVVEDGTLLTGQNHMSTKALAEALMNHLARTT